MCIGEFKTMHDVHRDSLIAKGKKRKGKAAPIMIIPMMNMHTAMITATITVQER